MRGRKVLMFKCSKVWDDGVRSAQFNILSTAGIFFKISVLLS